MTVGQAGEETCLFCEEGMQGLAGGGRVCIEHDTCMVGWAPIQGLWMGCCWVWLLFGY